jgi:tetratricopeptide (TPR) repeat protein
MTPTGHATRAQRAWRDADLRIWCVGGWWFQMKGGPRRRLDADDAATELLRHLALNVGGKTTRRDLQRWLARKPKEEVGVPSVTTAISTLRGVLREAGGDRDDLDRLVLDLIPRAKMAPTEDGTSSDAAYELPEKLVWVDIAHASIPALGGDLVPPAFGLAPVDGRGTKGEFQGKARWTTEVETRTNMASKSELETGLDPHLKRMTPPISSLTELVPMALDRLEPGTMLSILAPADSGRMHLAEAIEFAARIYCGRATEEIREQADEGVTGAKLSARQPGHLCILDATREVRREQIALLEEIVRSDRGSLPSLLVVRDGPLKEDLVTAVQPWAEAEPIQLPIPGLADVLEAYLIGSGEEGSVADRTEAFARLREAYEETFGAPVGLRAAVSAASIVARHHVLPEAQDLPEPPSEEFSFAELPDSSQRLARSLAWFGNRPFDLADARAVSGWPDLEESSIFGVATKIPGGAGAFELRPQLIDLDPPSVAYGRICRYLVEHPRVEPTIERWPGRALRILGRKEIPIEDRLELSMRLFETCRTQGLAPRLADAMERLRKEIGGELDEERAEFQIESARLLAYLDKDEEKRKEEADGLLVEVLKAAGRKKGRWSVLRARARLRRAIIASLRDDPKLAKSEAERVGRDPSMQRKVENFYGWEAIKTGHLEGAVAHFRRALEADGDIEDEADARLGLGRSLIRLDRRTEAERVIEPLYGLDLRRHTRNRLARVSAALCQMRGEPSAGIDLHIDPALLDTGLNFSASALLLEASAFLHLDAKEVNAAADDIERSRSILEKSGSEPNSAGRYVRALIYGAEAEEAHGHTAGDLLTRAREEADRCLGRETERDPWARARAQTLRGRLALLDGDRDGVAEPLQEALEAHRQLETACPELSQTLALAQRVAWTWGVAEERKRADQLMEQFDPKRSLRRPGLDEVLSVVEAVLTRVEMGPPEIVGAGGAGLVLLGRMGEAIAEAVVRAQMVGLRLQVLIPRMLGEISQGVYDPTPDGKALKRHPASPSRPLDLIVSNDEQRLVQRYATCVLLASAAEGEGSPYVAMGEWISELKVEARDRGIAIGNSIGIDVNEIERLVAMKPLSAVAVPLTELPALN